MHDAIIINDASSKCDLTERMEKTKRSPCSFECAAVCALGRCERLMESRERGSEGRRVGRRATSNRRHDCSMLLLPSSRCSTLHLHGKARWCAVLAESLLLHQWRAVSGCAQCRNAPRHLELSCCQLATSQTNAHKTTASLRSMRRSGRERADGAPKRGQGSIARSHKAHKRRKKRQWNAREKRERKRNRRLCAKEERVRSLQVRAGASATACFTPR